MAQDIFSEVMKTPSQKIFQAAKYQPTCFNSRQKVNKSKARPNNSKTLLPILDYLIW